MWNKFHLPKISTLMFRRIFLFFLFLLIGCSVTLRAQGLFSGRVVDTQQRPLQGVMVRIYDAAHKSVLAFTTTNAEGRYHLALRKEWGEEIIVRWQTLSYKTEEEKIKNTPIQRNITLQYSDKSFETVVVRAPIVHHRGDTIVYNVEQMRARGETNLEQVIKRIPGVEVDARGTIKYNGESINRFYIEGLNLLDNNYSLATRNIRPEDVSTISVLQNHQPVEVLKGVQWSKSAAFNITLKKKARLRPVGHVLAGGGLRENHAPHAQGELFALLLRSRSQTLLAGKFNNWARPYQGEAITSLGSNNASLADYVYADFPFGLAPIDAQRYQDATYAYASVHHLRALAPKNTLKFVGSYAYKNSQFDLHQTSLFQQSTGSPLVLEEHIGQQRWAHQAAMKVEWEKNLPKSYVKEDFSGSFSQHDALASLPLQRVAQEQVRQTFAINNRFLWKQRTGKQVRSWQLDFKLTNVPTMELSAFHTATKTNTTSSNVDGTTTLSPPNTGGEPATQATTVANASDTLFLSQRITTTAGQLAGQTGWAWVLGAHEEYGIFGVETKFYTTYEDFSLTSATTARTYRHWGGELMAEPYYQFRPERWGFKLHAPFTYRFHRFLPGDAAPTQQLARLFVAPRLTLSGVIARKMLFELSTSYEINMGGMDNIIDTPLYLTYRVQNVLGTGRLAFARTWGNFFSLYINPLSTGHSFQLMGNYSRTDNDLLAVSSIGLRGDEAKSMAQQASTQHLWMGSFRHTYSILEWHTKLGWNITYSGAQSQRLRQGELLPTTLHSARATAEMGVYLWQSTVQLNGNASIAQQWLLLPSHTRTLFSPSAQLRLAIHPRNHWEIYASIDYQRNPLGENQHVTAWFIDGGARYVWKKCEFTLTLRNLANQHHYAQQQYVLSDVFTKTTSLRPLEGMLSVKWQF